MREVVTFRFADQQLVGTLHRAAAPEASSVASASEHKRLAFLWLNSGYLPRSPAGDVISHLSDRFAEENGVWSFRIDLPGLGDSQGSLSDDTQTYFSRVARGLNVPAANAVAREVCERFGFDAVVMGGICGASITSIYAADAAESGPIAGLVLLDPSFKLVQPFQGIPKTSGQAPARPPLLRRLKETVVGLRIHVLEREWGQFLRRIWRRCKPYFAPLRRALRSIRGGARLPTDANRPLLDAFRRLARRGLPMLVVLAGDEHEYKERFDYVGLGLREAGGAITRHFLRGTNHAFIEGNGESEVRQRVTAWLRRAPG
jgi:hypothetical protein